MSLLISLGQRFKHTRLLTRNLKILNVNLINYKYSLTLQTKKPPNGSFVYKFSCVFKKQTIQLSLFGDITYDATILLAQEKLLRQSYCNTCIIDYVGVAVVYVCLCMLYEFQLDIPLRQRQMEYLVEKYRLKYRKKTISFLFI